jgi:hypothetical protein
MKELKIQQQKDTLYTINFETENFVVDWLSLNIRDGCNFTTLANYLFESLNFNIFKVKLGYNSKNEEYSDQILLNDKNHNCCFFVETSNNYWKGLRLEFRGKNGEHFYNLITTRRVDWSAFSLESTNLGRFDVNFQRTIQKDDLPEKLFFLETYQYLVESGRTVQIGHGLNSQLSEEILKIGKRSSARYYRIYKEKKKNSIKFEFEMKGKLVRKYQSDLFSGRFQNFEEAISLEFYKYSKRVLPLTHSYTDWLLIYSRKNRENTRICAVTTYLHENISHSTNERDCLWKFFQLLTFIRSLDDSKKVKKILSQQRYYDITFSLKEFVEFNGLKSSQYQIKKAKIFLELLYDLQKNQGLITQISENNFRSFAVFPALCIYKTGKFNSWFVSFSMAFEFYYYRYPILLPLEFLRFSDKYDREIKSELLDSMSKVSLKKRLNVEKFLDRFAVSNSLKRKIKEKIILLFELLRNKKYIKSQFILVDKSGKEKISSNLSTGLISQTRYLDFFENEP